MRSATLARIYLLEQFVPGDVFHVDSLVFDGEVVFAVASRIRHAADGGGARRRHLRHADAGERPIRWRSR